MRSAKEIARLIQNKCTVTVLGIENDFEEAVNGGELNRLAEGESWEAEGSELVGARHNRTRFGSTAD